MRVLVLGRTQALIDVAEAVARAGHEIVGVCTSDPPHWSECGWIEFKKLAFRFGAPFHLGPFVPGNMPPADVAISVNWPRRITSGLDAYPHGILNVHAGDLPRYRGRWPISWAILSGESKIGLCVHRMTEELDAGPVHCRSYYYGAQSASFGDVWRWVQRMIPGLFVQALIQIKGGEAPYPQEGEPIRCYPMNADIDGMINWTEPAEMITRRVRAFAKPLPGAYTTYAGWKVTIWRAERLCGPGTWRAAPGQICEVDNGRPVVACTDGLLRLTVERHSLCPEFSVRGRLM